MSEKLRLLSLFAGIGGFELGLERSGGFQTVAQCEIDPFCNKVLAKHWPEVKRYGDIRELTAARLAADGIAVDAICGGFPCQDISVAWDGPGLDGDRSGLWSEFRRLVDELKPKVVFIENVGNLRARGLADVVCSLAKIGYASAWHGIEAADVGAPHERLRCWIVAEREWTPVVFAYDCTPCPNCEEPVCPRCSKHYADCACPGPHSDGDGWQLVEEDWGLVAYPDLSGREKQCGPLSISAEQLTHELHRGWETEPPVLRVDDGFPGRVDRVTALGNAVVPQIPELLGRAWMEATNG